jgi:hypothetical protein
LKNEGSSLSSLEGMLCFKLNAERLFVHELARKYHFIKYASEMKQNIKARLEIDLSKFDIHRV